MTGSEFIRKLTELTRAGKVNWDRSVDSKFNCYTADVNGIGVQAMSHRIALRVNDEITHYFADDDLFNAISDTMPDIQTLFDQTIKELER